MLIKSLRIRNLLSFGPDTESLPLTQLNTAGLQESALPPLHALESRNRHDVQDKLIHATRECSNAYAKGRRSFEIPGRLSPAVLEQHLPSFARIRRILNANL